MLPEVADWEYLVILALPDPLLGVLLVPGRSNDSLACWAFTVYCVGKPTSSVYQSALHH